MNSDTHTHDNITSARGQLIADLFTTALEGGISYWADIDTYHWSFDTAPGEQFKSCARYYADITAEDGNAYHVNARIMNRGYVLATGSHRDKISWSSGHKPPVVITPDTEWDFDASDADVILQLGLFDDVIYG